MTEPSRRPCRPRPRRLARQLVWSSVTPLLAAAGRASTAIDMEGHGLDGDPARERARPPLRRRGVRDRALAARRTSTLASAAARLVDQIAAVGRPVVLVGHSMGGHVVTAAAQSGAAS